MSSELFKAFDVERRPESELSPQAYLLVEQGIRSFEEIERLGVADCLSMLLTFYIPLLKRNPAAMEALRKPNENTLKNETGININNPSLVRAIMGSYNSLNVVKMAEQGRLNVEHMPVVALRLGLDFAQGRLPKIPLDKTPHHFLPVPLTRPEQRIGSTEAGMSNIVEIFEDAEAQGVDVTHTLILLRKLAPHIWRSSVIQALRAYEGNVPLLLANQKLKRHGSDSLLTIQSETAHVRSIFHEARRRIGDVLNMDDLEKQLNKILSMTGKSN